MRRLTRIADGLPHPGRRSLTRFARLRLPEQDEWSRQKRKGGRAAGVVSRGVPHLCPYATS